MGGPPSLTEGAEKANGFYMPPALAADVSLAFWAGAGIGGRFTAFFSANLRVVSVALVPDEFSAGYSC